MQWYHILQFINIVWVKYQIKPPVVLAWQLLKVLFQFAIHIYLHFHMCFLQVSPQLSRLSWTILFLHHIVQIHIHYLMHLIFRTIDIHPHIIHNRLLYGPLATRGLILYNTSNNPPHSFHHIVCYIQICQRCLPFPYFQGLFPLIHKCSW